MQVIKIFIVIEHDIHHRHDKSLTSHSVNNNNNNNNNNPSLLLLFIHLSVALHFLLRTSASSHTRGFVNYLDTQQNSFRRVMSPSERPLPTQDSTAQKDEKIRPCLTCDMNPQSQRPCGQSLCLRPLGHWGRNYCCCCSQLNIFHIRL
jgi:hypothetical protein